ncbi:MAG: alkaline phosphatase D family protein [Agitococcus sp.]|nr:alkaline phosphatase D family protein [Agitococcus sp.]
MNMNRRQLLKHAGFLTSSVAVFGLVGCGSDNNSLTEEQTLSSAGHAGTYQFPQGVMAADPKPNSIILWTRVVVTGADLIAQVNAASADVMVQLELAASSAFDELLMAPIIISAQAKYDNTIRHKLMGLSSATTYYYRFRAGTGLSRVGRFKTAPAANASVDALNFAFIACQDWSVNHWVGMSALAKQNLDFLVHLGDYIYEAAGDSYQTEKVETTHDALKIPSQTLKPNSTSAKIAVTVEDYRYLYKKYRSDLRLQELHARYALIAIWDDHEFSDDCWQNNETYGNGSVTMVNGVLPVSNEQLGIPSAANADTRQTERRRAANRAWFEFMPADIPALDESVASNFATVKIYRDLKFGNLAHFVMTDERLYRADHVIPEALDNPLTAAVDQLGSINSRYFVPEPTFLQVQGGKMQAGIKGAYDSLPDTDANKAVLGTILFKLNADPTGATLTANEVAFFNEVGLTLVSVLGQTQRNWWKTTMASSTATWKFWGNEVSLLRMVLNLNQLPAVVAQANAMADAGYPAQKALLNSYIVNADQWDGYSAERANLLNFLVSSNIKNVVAVTGDIHSFFAGEVPANPASYTAGSAAMVDLVTAGVSSSSFWTYIASVVGDFAEEVKATKAARAANPSTYENLLEKGDNPFVSLRPLVYSCLNMLVYSTVRTGVIKAATGGAIDVGTITGQVAFAGLPDAQKVAIHRAVFEEYLNQESATGAAGYIPQNTLNETLAGDMGQTIQGLASALGVTIANPYTGTATPPAKQNPWIKFAQTHTQGFITVKVTAAQVEAKFHHTLPLVSSAGVMMNPTADNVVTLVKTVTINKDSTLLTVS